MEFNEYFVQGMALLGAGTVSYTHLDVYKRQAYIYCYIGREFLMYFSYE